MQRFLKRAADELLSPAMLVAVLALALSLGGTAYAAKLITSKEIKNGTIQVKDLSPKAVKALKGKRGAAGANGTNGTNGADGATGADFTEGIPSGRTITGSVYYAITAGAAAQALNQSIAFPAKAPTGVTSANFAPDASEVTNDDEASCTGTYAEPTAPAGQVCLYAIATTNVTSVHASTLVPGQDKGFIVLATSTAAGSLSVDFSWAYTAP